MINKRKFFTGVIVVTILGSSAFAIFAQDGGTAPLGMGGMGRGGMGMMGGMGHGGMGMMGGMGHGGMGMMDSQDVNEHPMFVAIAGALSITPEELQTALQAGSTVTALAEEKGVELQVVIDAALAAHNAHLTSLVAEGTITQEQADAHAERMTANIANMPLFTGEAMGMGDMMGGMMGRGGFGHPDAVIDTAIAEALGITSDELHTALQGGSTVTTLAEEKGIELQVVIDAAIEAHDAHLATLVEAGTITQEQADANAEQFAANVATSPIFTGETGMGGMMGRGNHGMMGGHGGRGGNGMGNQGRHGN